MILNKSIEIEDLIIKLKPNQTNTSFRYTD